MKILKPILFFAFLIGSFLVLVKDASVMFSLYAIIAFPVAILIILLIAIWDYRAKSKLSIFALFGLISGVLLYMGNEKYKDYRWQNELDHVMIEIENYHQENQNYPQELSDLPIVLSKLSSERNIRYRLDEESGKFIIEYTKGFSTVYNYNSERKSWDIYVEWGAGR